MEGFAPFAIRRPGPLWKQGYPGVGVAGPKRGDVKHSAEGTNWDVIHDLLDGQARKSWQFTVGYDRTEQHYPFMAHCWHAGDADDDGGVRANIDLVGIEHLGVAGDPLTDYQVEMTVKITRWCAEQSNRTRYARYPTQLGVWTLAEHNQVSDTATACPSGRIRWLRIIAALEEQPPTGEDDMVTLIRTDGSFNVYATDGMFKWRLASSAIREELQRAGVLPAADVKIVSQEALDAIPQARHSRQITGVLN